MLVWIYLLFKAAVFAAKLEKREKKLFQRHWRFFGFHSTFINWVKAIYKTPNHSSELTVAAQIFFPLTQ